MNDVDYRSPGNESDIKVGKPLIPNTPSDDRRQMTSEVDIINRWPKQSIYVKCLECRQKGNTKVIRTLSRCGIFLFIILIPTIVFAILVLCIESLYISKHYCEHCGSYYGASEH